MPSSGNNKLSVSLENLKIICRTLISHKVISPDRFKFDKSCQVDWLIKNVHFTYTDDNHAHLATDMLLKLKTRLITQENFAKKQETSNKQLPPHLQKPNKPVNSNNPRYKFDKPYHIFLGQDRQYDLYFDINIANIVAVRGDRDMCSLSMSIKDSKECSEGSAINTGYQLAKAKGLILNEEKIAEAFKRAKEKGYIKEETVKHGFLDPIGVQLDSVSKPFVYKEIRIVGYHIMRIGKNNGAFGPGISFFDYLITPHSYIAGSHNVYNDDDKKAQQDLEKATIFKKLTDAYPTWQSAIAQWPSMQFLVVPAFKEFTFDKNWKVLEEKMVYIRGGHKVIR